MSELKTIKILIGFCLFLAIFGGFMFLKQGWLSSLPSISPKNEGGMLTNLSYLTKIAGFTQEKTYLLLFQNNLELRPSGGYLGNFGIMKIKNGKVISFEVHDTNIFDGFGQTQTEPPQPMKDYLGISNWQMRDVNWSPDFPTSAEQVEYFYRLQGGQEKFDGIIGLNASLLPNLLELTGPIYLEEFDLNFNSQNALYQLEYEIEKGYVERSITTGERKTVFKKLVKKVLDDLTERNPWQWLELKNLVLRELEEKNILLYFKKTDIQNEILKLGWAGKADETFDGDYLMIVEANLGAQKSNFFIDREIEYHLDLANEKPTVELKIKYQHRGETIDWFSGDYRAYLRIYTTKGSQFIEAEGVAGQVSQTEELNKTVFGHWIEIGIGTEKIIKYKYTLPDKIKQTSDYRILVQKQIGLDELNFNFILKDINGQEFRKDKTIRSDWEGIVFLEK